MRIFYTKKFADFVSREGILDSQLIDAINRAEKGLINANLGGGVIKQRIARTGEGKSGGYRTIIIFKSQYRSFFVYGFAKKVKENINDIDLKAIKKFAANLQELSDEEINILIKKKLLFEVINDA